GCIPACRNGIRNPGVLGDGDFRTKWFFGGGMHVMLTGGWSSHEDSSGELALTPDATPNNDVLFWEDVYPVSRYARVKGVPDTRQGLLAWLLSDPRLDAANVHTGAIGTLPATVVDVKVDLPGARARASYTDPLQVDCPARPCIAFLGFPVWEG